MFNVYHNIKFVGAQDKMLNSSFVTTLSSVFANKYKEFCLYFGISHLVVEPQTCPKHHHFRGVHRQATCTHCC